MQVEITKMVYQHPWYVSSALPPSNGRLGGLFIGPTEKVAVGDEIPLFFYWPDAAVILTGRVRSPQPLSVHVEIGRTAEFGHHRPDTSSRICTILELL